MKMIDHNHFICHLILGTFTEYPFLDNYIYTNTYKNYFSTFFPLSFTFFNSNPSI